MSVYDDAGRIHKRAFLVSLLSSSDTTIIAHPVVEGFEPRPLLSLHGQRLRALLYPNPRAEAIY